MLYFTAPNSMKTLNEAKLVACDLLVLQLVIIIFVMIFRRFVDDFKKIFVAHVLKYWWLQKLLIMICKIMLFRLDLFEHTSLLQIWLLEFYNWNNYKFVLYAEEAVKCNKLYHYFHPSFPLFWILWFSKKWKK